MSEKYLLARDYHASTRLNFQYYLWKEAIGYTLHPSIPVPGVGADWKVADVATGTGIWITELAKIAPKNSSLHGYDVSAEQFPHPSGLPENVVLETLDATKPPPEHLCGVYDVVHLRLLMAVVNEGDPLPILNHCMKLLKVGGYLQWDEMDPMAFNVPSQPGNPGPCLSALAKIWAFTKPTEWIAKLPQIFEEHGLDRVVGYTHTEQVWQRRMMMEIWCLVAEDHAVALKDNGMAEKASDTLKLAVGAHQEIKGGAFYPHRLQVAIGRVPVQDKLA